jgi:hypothetical protein
MNNDTENRIMEKALPFRVGMLTDNDNDDDCSHWRNH